MHELRKDDKAYNCGGYQNNDNCSDVYSYSGTYLSVDGSGMRYVFGDMSNPEKVLYMPDGGRYFFQPYEASPYEYIDRNGNKTVFDAATNKLTDTLGREIINPLGSLASIGTQAFNLPGLDGQNLTYTKRWELLKPAGCATGNEPICEEAGLENPADELYFLGNDTCEGQNYDQPVGSPRLFDGYEPISDPVRCEGGGQQAIACFQDTRKQRICSGTERYNPGVLTEIALPDGSKYKFKYNRYGEMTKIIYPTGAYERFRYDLISTPQEYPFSQTGRGVVERWVSVDGITETQNWQYSNTALGRITTINPDNIKTERYVHLSVGFPHGFEDPRAGMPFDEKVYSKPAIAGDEQSRTLLRRELTDWIVAPPRPGGNAQWGVRDARPAGKISIIFEPGAAQALAQMTETVYDTHSDPEYFAHLNPKQVKTYNFVAVDITTAKDADFNQLAAMFSSANLAAVTETDYLYDANYKARGIIGLPTETHVLNPSNPSDVLARSQVLYDEAAYFDNNYTTTNWVDPNSNFRGNVTTMRTWVKETDTWLETHTMFDNFGNVRKVWDASNDPGKFVETQYDPLYKYAYPTKVIAPAPDPTNTTGTDQTSIAETTYDFTTGLPLSVRDDFGQITRTEYDGMLRPLRGFAENFIAPESQTVYGVPNSSGQISADQRFVKVRKQIDAANWDEAITWFDGLGRTIKTQARDSQGDVFAETKYDNFGRVERVTNPYRLGDTVYWSKTRYDAAGRAVESYAPAELANLGSAASLGVTSFDISTVANFVGTVVTTTDASGRKGRSITNALGQLLRVDEPTAIGGTADADLGTFASPNQPTFYKYDLYGKMVEVTQGVQKRWFKYDSLGRLLRVRQPEQEINTSLNLADSFNISGQWTAGFTYDVLGNVLTATDANGVTITNTYDRAGRVKTRSYSDVTPPVSFYYDGKGLAVPQSPNFAKGKLTKVTSSVSETRYSIFDNFGRLKESSQITDGNTYTSKYTYNLSGALVEEEYPSGRKVKNEFESDGDLLNVTSKKTGSQVFTPYVSNFSYTASGGISQLRLGNGKWETAKFNTRLQVTELGLGNSATNASVWKVNIDYGELDESGNVVTSKNTGNIAKQTLSFTGLANPIVQAYKYDSLYRLTEAKETANNQENWIQNFGYDRYGNRTAFSQNIAGTTANTTPPVDINTNRFEINQGFTYDKNGNVVTDIDAASSLSRMFVFNGDNKQTEVKRDGITIGRYYYDGEGKRIKKVTDDETTVFVYSAGKLIAEYSTQLATQPSTNYTTTDHLGSPRIITDQFGQVKSRRDFMPFGENLFNGVGARSSSLNYGSSTDDIKQRFTGYLKDNETGLDFAEARMYENRHGRFTAIDPLLASGKSSNPQTFNRYIYVGNNPLLLIDKNGLIWGINEKNQVRWFAKNLGKGYTSFTPDNWQYKGKDDRLIQLDASSSKWNHVDPVRVVAESNPLQDLAIGVSQGYEDAKSGAAKGAANTFIDTWNFATGMALNMQGGRYVPSSMPNPFAIERYPVYSATEARFSVGVQLGLTLSPSAGAAPFSAGSSLSVVPEMTNTVTVGRWMSQVEFSAMKSTGMVQESFTGTTHVAFPANPNTFIGPARSGSLYVEFGVPRTSVVPSGSGNASIAGPSSLAGRNAFRFGRPIPQMPPASNPFCFICRTNVP